MSKITVIHGPNLNLLGIREPGLYGSETLESINQRLGETIEAAGHGFEAYQSNAEHELVDKVQSSGPDTAFIIINPGAYGHTSIAETSMLHLLYSQWNLSSAHRAKLMSKGNHPPHTQA